MFVKFDRGNVVRCLLTENSFNFKGFCGKACDRDTAIIVNGPAGATPVSPGCRTIAVVGEGTEAAGSTVWSREGG